MCAFFPKRPSQISDMKATRNRLYCWKGFLAIVLFGHIFTRRQEDADRLNSVLGPDKIHEMIHLRQAQSTGDSWFRYYTLYIYYSLRAITYVRKMHNAMYYLNPFEIEAYAHMYDRHYLDNSPTGANGWRIFARMSLAARMRYVRMAGIAR